MRRRLSLLAVLGAALVIPGTTFAHGGNARIELDRAAVPAGGSVTVRGVELGADEAVDLALIASDGRAVTLGSATADAEGGFSLTVTLPADLVEGAAIVRATLPDGDDVQTAVEVLPPLSEEGEQRAEEEPLLAPMASPSARPTVAPAAATSSVAAASVSPASADHATDDPGVPGAADLAWVAAALVAVVALGIVLLRRRAA